MVAHGHSRTRFGASNRTALGVVQLGTALLAETRKFVCVVADGAGSTRCGRQA
jgi:hypothetical protein